jgi:hypothetical protein
MQVHLRTRRAAICALAGVLALAGCSTGSPTGAPTNAATGGPPATASTPPVSPTVAPTEAAVLILEDAGLETPMTPGTYTSRLFEPAFTVELGEGWIRRDAGTDRVQNVRRGEDGGEDLTFISGIDFIECGDSGVVEPPDASTVVDTIIGMPKLDVSQPAEVQVGSLLGTEIRLAATRDALPDDAWERLPEFGCVISLGDVPYPGDSGWVELTRDMTMQLVLLDVGDRVVLLRARPDNSTDEVEALWDFMRDVIETVDFG